MFLSYLVAQQPQVPRLTRDLPTAGGLHNEYPSVQVQTHSPPAATGQDENELLGLHGLDEPCFQ